MLSPRRWGYSDRCRSQYREQFSGDILIGNFGDGKINVYHYNETFVDQLRDTDGKTIAIDGLWTLTLGGGAKSSSDTLYFTAGPDNETNGLFGTNPGIGAGIKGSG